MKEANPKIDIFLKRVKQWRAEMEKLRSIILDCGLTEELKWGKPCYTFQNNNIVIIQGFKESCALLFCKGALLKDAQGILQKPGENTQAARRILFTGVSEITRLAPTLKAYIQEAVKAEKAGLEVEFKKDVGPVPEELARKFAGNPGLKSAFYALTPGRQRAYLIYFTAPKQSQTRTARIEKYTPQILKGKGMHDEYLMSKPKAKPQKNEQGIVLLSGGNPQIAKADGDAPVQAYIAAMPGWKSELGKRLDTLITRNVPNVRKAVKWNSPFYGVEGKGWFLSFHVLTRYVKVTFFKGTSLKPNPPGSTPKSGDSRWLDIYENDPLDEAQMIAWVKQAASIPGWIP